MPKNDFMTPKAIGNRIKSIGLQKLRWYCQMCQKQCRDENGFKCHASSEAHLRQMKLFSENSHSHIDNFSQDFERGYLETLSHRHGTKRVLANRIYQEYIGDKHHIHMNATVWTNLTAFCLYLGREGKAVVDETERGWFIQYIDRDPKVLAKQLQRQERQQTELDDEERMNRLIQMQILKAHEKIQQLNDNGKDNVDDDEGDELGDNADSEGKLPVEAVHMKLSSVAGGHDAGSKRRKLNKLAGSCIFNDGDDEDDADGVNITTNNTNDHQVKPSTYSSSSHSSSSSTSSSLSNIDKLILDDELNKKQMLLSGRSESKNRKDYWLCEGIIVKVKNKQLKEGKYYNQKGAVLRVIDRYVGEIQMLDSADKIRIDQDQCESVIPQVGGRVRVVNGRGRGSDATVQAIDMDKYCCDIRVDGFERTGGLLIKGVEYEDICKLA